MIEEIKEVYDQLDNKKDFNMIAAKKFRKSVSTIKSHWISDSSMPLEYQKEFLLLLKKVRKTQVRYKNSLNKLLLSVR